MARWLLCNKIYFPDGTVMRPAREVDDAQTPLATLQALGAVFLALPNPVGEVIARLMRHQQSNGWTDEEAQAFLLAYARPSGSGSDAAYLQTVPIDPVGPSADFQALMSLAGVWTPQTVTQDMIAAGLGITMTGVAPLVHEIGQPAVTPGFTATYTGPAPTTIVLTDSVGTAPKNVTATPAAFASNGTFAPGVLNTLITFTATVTRGLIARASSVVHAWQPKLYIGTAVPGVLNSAFITALASQPLAADPYRSTNYAPAANEKCYFALPTAYPVPTFRVNGLAYACSLVASSVNITNAFSVTHPYNLWASDVAGLAPFTLVTQP